MKPNSIEVKIGRFPLNVPIVINEQTTLELVDKVNARLEQVEQESTIIDTHAFALIAAMSFAAELQQAKTSFAEQLEQVERERTEDTREILLALDAIYDMLRDALTEHQREE